MDQDGIAVGEPHADAAGKAAVHDGIALKVQKDEKMIADDIRGRSNVIENDERSIWPVYQNVLTDLSYKPDGGAKTADA